MSTGRSVMRSVLAASVALSGLIGGPTVAAGAAPAAAPAATTVATASSPVAPFPAGITRLGGTDRYATAVAVSQRFSAGVPVVFVATGLDFPDALSASAAAAHLGGPLLLTGTTSLPPVVKTELTRLKPAHIYAVGGPSVVAPAVVDALNQIAPTDRLAGLDRYATADAVIATAFPKADHAILATGRAFPDALAASGAAGSRQAPVILVDGMAKTLAPMTSARLQALGVTSVGIAGGSDVLSSGIEAQLVGMGLSVQRYGGTTRYQTAAILNRAYFPSGSSSTALLATGATFPDALAGGVIAGLLPAPLELSWRTCVDPTVGDQIADTGATSMVLLGDAGVVADSAGRNARCVYPDVTQPLADWATSGFPIANDVVPYSDRPPVDVNSTSIQLDSSGLLIYKRIDNGVQADHPVAYAQYGISALLEFQRTGDRIWLDRATRQASQLVAMHTDRAGAWWYPYTFPWTYYGRTLTAPWWSGMAQGEALSLFVRLADVTGDPRWTDAATHTFASLTQGHSSTAPWASLVIDRHLYFEEYAGNQPPLLVLNGHIFAIFGVYDYWKKTGDPTAKAYLDGAATTVLERMMPIVREPGAVSYYCVQAEYCQVPGWQNPTYHVIHSWQLDTLAKITGDARFTSWAQLLRNDWTPPATTTTQRQSSPTTKAPSVQQQGAPDLGTL